MKNIEMINELPCVEFIIKHVKKVLRTLEALIQLY